MFAIGVQLSFRDLLRVGRVATLGAGVQVLVTIGGGYLMGMALGWEPPEALFLGAVVSNSSSTVLSKTLGERGEIDSEHGRIGLAWSSVQDLSTVVLVVVLSALATGGDALLPELAWAVVKAGIFLGLGVSIGSAALPWLFDHVASLRSQEVFVLVTAAVALGMAYASSFFGLSLALGAFVAGVVVSESDLSHQVLGEVGPIRDIFAALFFVLVGMLVNPVFVVTSLPLILLALALIVLFKGALVAGLMGLFGYTPRVALLTGVTLAQSAKFSFLLARLGADLNAVSFRVFNLMLGGTLVSIVLPPLVYRGALVFADRLESWLLEFPLSTHSIREDGNTQPPRRHALICGYCSVGGVIGAALARRGFSYIVIEEDPQVVKRLRERGIPALLGNAANRVLLERAGLERARVLLVALPDPVTTRLIVEHARRISPDLEIGVRTHSWEERDFMVRHRVGRVVMGELETALGLTE